MTDETPQLPNEVQIEVNDNTTAFNHNIGVRITDADRKFTAEELTKIAMDRIKEARELIDSNS